jgi:nicotinate-nucleotide adenylyltransferase
MTFWCRAIGSNESTPLNRAKRLGILGGAFDPPHIAHIALAKHAIAQFDLNELRVIPTGDAWHKTRILTPSPHRLAMTRLAFADVAHTRVDPREIDREGATYTIDTLQELKTEQPEADLYLFIGADQANAFKTWHRWQDILALARVVVADRPMDGQGGKASQWHNAVSPDVQRLDMPSLNVSATEIRAHVAQGTQADSKMHTWLPAAVQHYIEKHSLYR